MTYANYNYNLNIKEPTNLNDYDRKLLYGEPEAKFDKYNTFINDLKKNYGNINTTTEQVISDANKLLQNINLKRFCCRPSLSGDKNVNMYLPEEEDGEIKSKLSSIKITENDRKKICDTLYNSDIQYKNIEEAVTYPTKKTGFYNKSDDGNKKGNTKLCDAFYYTYCRYLDNIHGLDAYKHYGKDSTNECGCINSKKYLAVEQADNPLNPINYNHTICLDQDCQDAKAYHPSDLTLALSDCPALCLNIQNFQEMNLDSSSINANQSCSVSQNDRTAETVETAETAETTETAETAETAPVASTQVAPTVSSRLPETRRQESKTLEKKDSDEKTQWIKGIPNIAIIGGGLGIGGIAIIIIIITIILIL